MYDSALAPSAVTVKGFAGKSLCGGDQPFSLHTWPYTRHRFCIPEVKTALRGRKFADVKDIRKNITVTINSVPLDTFNGCFVEFLERCYKCVTFEGK